jgi:hypothetical protein
MRASEFFIYINLEKHPLPSEIPFYFHHLKIDKIVQKTRKQYRKKKKALG